MVDLQASLDSETRNALKVSCDGVSRSVTGGGDGSLDVSVLKEGYFFRTFLNPLKEEHFFFRASPINHKDNLSITLVGFDAWCSEVNLRVGNLCNVKLQTCDQQAYGNVRRKLGVAHGKI